jgi:hypothetical protein
MAERSRPALDGPGGSPVPEGYGSLDDVAPVVGSPGPGGPARPRRPGRRLPQARSTVAADARQAEARAESRAAEEELTSAPRPSEVSAERAAAEAQEAGRIMAEQQAVEAELVKARQSDARRPEARQSEARQSEARQSEVTKTDVRPSDLSVDPAGSDPTVVAGARLGSPSPSTQQRLPRPSDAQAAEEWAAQRRLAVQESRRAADIQGLRPGLPSSAPTIGLPAAAPMPAATGMTAATAARRELWEEEDHGAARFRRRQKVRVVRSTSSRRLVRRIDTWTVFKVSFVFYLLALVILVVAGIILWNVAEAFGTIASIQKSAKSLFDLSHFVIKPIPLLEYTTGGGAILCVLGTVVNTVVALLYNLISDVIGGVQVVVVTEPD